ncbi:hypothetical protein CSA56_09325 [candidate division KSB3 bacterium]|uniref:Ion-translocating oxidoreductase complex subunit G n=1 Tax=candidate division KSB3 bacterium TaxID=2044937 RepID=A0A2G6KDY9_9BACT|nr:MAG: hypothetical protein CSA56_09325 [candidate division KSB3 bacterium]
MNSVIKQMFTVLILVGSLSGMVLAGSYSLTKPFIEQHKLEELKESIFVVLPDAKSYEDISANGIKLYKGLSESNEPAGYAFVAEGTGFQGVIRMIVGIAPDLETVLGMQVLEQVETPGLGAKITEDSFEQQFSGLQPAWEDALIVASQAQKDAEAGTEEAPAEQTTFEFLSYVKIVEPDDPNEIQAITGATISSAAVIRIINQHLDDVWEMVQEQHEKEGAQ